MGRGSRTPYQLAWTFAATADHTLWREQLRAHPLLARHDNSAMVLRARDCRRSPHAYQTRWQNVDAVLCFIGWARACPTKWIASATAADNMLKAHSLSYPGLKLGIVTDVMFR